MILKDRQRKALREVAAMGQYNGWHRPSRAERKAAKWAWRVLEAEKAHASD